MGRKYHFVYFNDSDIPYSINIVAKCIDEALHLFRLDHGDAFIAMICVL
jgi:hypothetical protein